MRLHWLQHVPFEGLGSIADWAAAAKAIVTCTRFHRNEALPAFDAFDGLIVMGGPMGVYDHAEFPWLLDETAFIRAAIAARKPVLGICLGAQLIAAAQGARVYRNRDKEIGWFKLSPGGDYDPARHGDLFAGDSWAFHWHGDTFDLPAGALHLAASAACRHQAYAIGEHVLGLQCHLESTPASVAALIANCGSELTPAPYIQTAAEMLADDTRFAAIRPAMHGVLRRLFQ